MPPLDEDFETFGRHISRLKHIVGLSQSYNHVRRPAHIDALIAQQLEPLHNTFTRLRRAQAYDLKIKTNREDFVGNLKLLNELLLGLKCFRHPQEKYAKEACRYKLLHQMVDQHLDDLRAFREWQWMKWKEGPGSTWGLEGK
ncbi:MAG: hypothetical protein L6R42_007686 [Xanthoria sp. 1 TBL-2021]|nr:MAG: hypothetical protein L6R42_007686 [Xanthoria sp. 1 TBL-2021]